MMFTVAFSVMIGAAVLVLEVLTAIKLYRSYRSFKRRENTSAPLNFGMVLRVIIFAFYFTVVFLV
jgi:hypothetical protein